MTEFLHYTAAPLVVKLYEDESVGSGNQPDSLLRYCLDENRHDDSISAVSAALEFFGEDGIAFCDKYLFGLDYPPLWDLAPYQPSSAEILESLNYIELLLANWQQTDNQGYPALLVSEDELSLAMAAMDDGRIPILSPGIDKYLRGYCPELYAIVKDYYRKAAEQGFDLDDKDLRIKLVR